MRPLRIAPVLAFALLFAPPAPAWNYVTHRVIAAIAYTQLTPAARARVDALIQAHPDYATHFLKNAPADAEARARAAFIEAAVWADELRNDARFYDGDRRDPTPTPLLAGFPGMQRHSGWHFTDLPFSQDGTPLEPPPVPNIVTELERLIAEIARPGATLSSQSYDLAWIIHMVGDIHAPLHCVSRFSAAQPKGDQGGNLVFLHSGSGNGPAITLHKFWDDAVGADVAPAWVSRTAQEIGANLLSKIPYRPPGSPQTWSQESLGTAQTKIYTFGTENGTRELPLTLPAAYATAAHGVARDQVALAADRLAEILNRRLDSSKR